MEVILFDGSAHQSLWPLTATKPVAKIRIGILTLEEKWNHYLETEVGFRTKDYLASKYQEEKEASTVGVFAAILPTEQFAKKIKAWLLGMVPYLQPCY